MQVCRRDPDERRERAVGMPLPVELSHRCLLLVTGRSTCRKYIVWWLRVHGHDFVPVSRLVMTHDKNEVPALECGYWPCPRPRDIRLAVFCERCAPRVPVVSRRIHASRHRFQLPSGAELIAILAEQVSDRHSNGVWPLVLLVWRAEGGADLGVFRSAGERGSEGIRVGDASCEAAAFVPLVIWLQAIDAADLLRHVELGRIFKVGGPAHVGFFRHPAFVADVPMPGALVDRCYDSARLR